MHELSIAQSILAIAGKALPANETAAVTGIGLQIGELSAIEIDSLVFAFSVIREDTPFSQAELEIELIPGEAVCLDCNTVFPLSSYGTACPGCQGFSIQIRKGQEMKVLHISVA